MKLKDKFKFALRYPTQVLPYAIRTLTSFFLNKEQRSVKFFKANYLHLKPDFLFSKLKEYWDKYRYFDEISELIRTNKPAFSKNKILDIGCGYTSVLNILPGGERYGIDIVINSLKKNNFPLDKDIKWINSGAEKIPFKKDYFDIVFCSNALDHCDNPKLAISEIKRVLKNKGLFILTIDVFDKDIGYRDKRHPHSYTENKILNELNGFDILLKKKSPLNAQFYRFIKDGIVARDDEKELILVIRLNK